MPTLIAATFAAALVSTPPVAGLDKVPELARKDVLDYVKDKPVVGKAAIVDVEHLVTDGAEGGTHTETKVLLGETAGSGGGCRYREHRIERSGFDKDGAGNAEGSSGEYASDCCALYNDFPCDRTGLDWMLHYDRARRAGDGKALGRLAYKAFTWKLTVSAEGEVSSKTHTFKVPDLEKRKGVGKLPALDPLRMALGCEPPDDKGYFMCTASQGGNHLRFYWRHVGDKTKKRFETKLIRIESDEH